METQLPSLHSLILFLTMIYIPKMGFQTENKIEKAYS